MQTLLEWRRAKNASLLLVTHDVQTAARCCDRIVMLSGGSVLTQGRPSEVLTVDILRQVYGRGVVMHTNPDDNLPVILPELNAARVSAETKE
jgi:iron complex transport system ATP-binding protein